MIKCVVIPKGKSISGILPNNKRITEKTEICLNKREILKCMKYGDVYVVRNDNTTSLIASSDDINKEIKQKVKERQPELSQMLLDTVGIKEQDKKSYEKNIEPYRNNSNQQHSQKKNNKRNR